MRISYLFSENVKLLNSYYSYNARMWFAYICWIYVYLFVYSGIHCYEIVHMIASVQQEPERFKQLVLLHGNTKRFHVGQVRYVLPVY